MGFTYEFLYLTTSEAFNKLEIRNICVGLLYCGRGITQYDGRHRYTGGIQMKKIGKVAVLLLLCSLAGGCAHPKEEVTDKEEAAAAVMQRQEEEPATVTQEEIQIQQEDAGDEKVQVHQEETVEKDEIKLIPAQKVEAVGSKEDQGRSLTLEELQKFDEWISRQDNYGFLLSVYDTPADVDLGEVFYCGAGIEQEEVTDEEKEAYLHACGWDEIYTDFEKLTTQQMEAFLQQKTGLSYEQMNTRLKWTYLPAYDAYYAEHGDTNYRAFSCVEGYTADEQVFTLRCRPCGFDDLDADGYHIMDYELTLEKCGEEYQFRSNRMMWEMGLIEDQSFTVTLEPLGDVIFASYAPDTYAHPFADASFFLLRNGEEFRQLRGTVERNIRDNEVFNAVEAVAFTDYNMDGNTDIIIITAYLPASDTEPGAIRPEIRLYEGKNEYLYYDEELSETVNNGTEEKTIRAVIDFLSENG